MLTNRIRLYLFFVAIHCMKNLLMLDAPLRAGL